jgi:hypothetical protein
MTTQNLVLVTRNVFFKVTLKNCGSVEASDILSLLDKTATDVWRWARCHSAKVYFEDFLPPEFNHAISHASNINTKYES